MATRKTATKTTKKASSSLGFDLNNKSSKKTSRKVKKHLNKLSVGAVLGAILLLIFGAAGGFFGVKYITKNDCFVLNGKDELTLQIGENYADDGAKVIAFGRDETSKVEIKTNLIINADGTYTSNQEGTFYMLYTVDNLKYGSIFKIQKIRLITFVEASEQEEIDRADQGGES